MKFSLLSLILVTTAVALFVGLISNAGRYEERRTIKSAVMEAREAWDRGHAYLYQNDITGPGGAYIVYQIDASTGLEVHRGNAVGALYLDSFNSEIESKITTHGLPIYAKKDIEVPSVEQLEKELAGAGYTTIDLFPASITDCITVHVDPSYRVEVHHKTRRKNPQYSMYGGSSFPAIEYKKKGNLVFFRYDGRVVRVLENDGTPVAECTR